jgi:hypothetical protein
MIKHETVGYQNLPGLQYVSQIIFLQLFKLKIALPKMFFMDAMCYFYPILFSQSILNNKIFSNLTILVPLCLNFFSLSLMVWENKLKYLYLAIFSVGLV